MCSRLPLLLLLGSFVWALGGCGTPSESVRSATASMTANDEPDDGDDITTAMTGVSFHEVTEAFISAPSPEDNVDSPASWKADDGSTWVLVTAKGTDQLLIYDGDSGELLRRFGGSGSGPGQLSRPNGIFVIDDYALVVERDNQRVQVFGLPGLESLGSFGQRELIKPYGLWVRSLDSGFEVLVTDAYMSPEDEDLVPALTDLGKRIKRYVVSIENGRAHARYSGSFGDIATAGAIRVPESLWADPVADRLLIAEEDQPTGTRLRLYGLDLRYRGADLGADLFKAQAEGIALWTCADGSGYWIGTDQYKDRSVFHLFDRQSLAHLGAFAGSATANTDGIWLEQRATRRFPHGVLYAIDDDQALSAFDWADIAAAMGVRGHCP